ncbi:hypothetical protein [Cyclobacterium qasimii]|uniref:Uncharacterized protein n=1 Tax=Cyclobacterium qasimii TaxID=1350429 RepID=A0A512CHY4_9BACT|nr:hypothetical protein [Cyclobacterium qasimii]GEO23822.1 hypothetical protein CQA01_43560 [Cyclobacterium qasimii]
MAEIRLPGEGEKASCFFNLKEKSFEKIVDDKGVFIYSVDLPSGIYNLMLDGKRLEMTI